jgi:hypothetical protein
MRVDSLQKERRGYTRLLGSGKFGPAKERDAERLQVDCKRANDGELSSLREGFSMQVSGWRPVANPYLLALT